MADRVLTPAESLLVLAETPRIWRDVAKGVTEQAARRRPAPDEWSLVELLAHLRACADVWGGSIARILEERRPKIEGMDPRRWMRATNYPELELRRSLRAYLDQRRRLLVTLDALPQRSWDRVGVVGAWGQVYERTVRNYADRLARHERAHHRQIRRTAALVAPGAATDVAGQRGPRVTTRGAPTTG